MSRLRSGGLVDRTRPLSFTFDGRRLSGYAGDTLASALVANDVRLVGRSFKYHRPRGLLTAGGEEPNGLVTLGSGAGADPNTRATTTWLHEGLRAVSQNRWPSLACDLMAVNQLVSPLLVAGFYYKTFMWPAAFWERVYEPLIRRAAGLGALSGLADPSAYDQAHAFCDLLVIGAGPAGLAAALTAGRSGMRVILAHDDAQLGGALLGRAHEIDGAPGAQWAAGAAAELQALPNVSVLTRTLVFGVYDGCEYGAVEALGEGASSDGPRQRFWKINAARAILAAGAVERPLVFAGNDRPGVMQATAVSTYIHRFAAVPGARAVVFTTTDSGWQTALDLHRAGAEVLAVVDPRARPPALAEGLLCGTAVHTGAVVAAAHGAPLRSVTLRLATGREVRLDCDLLAMSGGWNPAIGLASNLGGRPRWSEDIQSFVAEALPPGLEVAGAAAGRFGLAGGLADGARQAIAAGARGPAPAWRADDEPAGVSALWRVPGRGKAFVDFQHDVTDQDIALAAQEGFRSVEHLKRYTTLGMATDQGKTSQVNGHALLAAATGKSIAEAGTIMSRPPYLPVAIGALAGAHRQQHYRPTRLTESHEIAASQGASFVEAGLWLRARWFTQSGERDWQTTVRREVNAVRNGVGVVDVSTLGKIEVRGPAAGELLDRLYINTFSTLGVGRARYGVMLREDGVVMDDGTVVRFGEETYYLTTTTANAAKVLQHIDFARQVLWPELDVQAASVTEQWATYAVAGPQSRDLLTWTFPELDLTPEGLPFLGALEAKWRGRPLRIVRVSFSGELAYEVSVAALWGASLYRVLLATGAALGVTPYGTEAMSVLRIEKGHAAGPELDGRTTAADLGLGRMAKKKKDYIGRRLTERPGLADPDRPTLVGLRPVGGTTVLPAGAHLMNLGDAPRPAGDQGWISSAAYSPTLGCWIALAFVRGGPARLGERLRIYDPLRGQAGEVEITSPVFVDPEGTRANV